MGLAEESDASNYTILRRAEGSGGFLYRRGALIRGIRAWGGERGCCAGARSRLRAVDWVAQGWASKGLSWLPGRPAGPLLGGGEV
jgi:hypothetical protein